MSTTGLVIVYAGYFEAYVLLEVSLPWANKGITSEWWLTYPDWGIHYNWIMLFLPLIRKWLLPILTEPYVI